MSTTIEFFIIGISVSFGPCLAFCSPLILPYIAATRRGWKEGLVAILTFSFAQLVIYVLLGLLAAQLGNLLTEWLHQFEYIFFIVGGLFISLIGFLIILGKDYHHHLCQALRRHTLDNNLKGPIMFGLIVGILPCLPLLGVLAYIALKTQNLWQGAFYGLIFGIGKLISPIILLGVLSSTLPERLIKNNKVYNLFSRICGFILFFIGVNIALSKLWK